MEFEAILLVVASSIAFCAAVGGWISHLKNRRPLEGFFLGALLGPIGLLLELKMPFAHRPMVDQGAWNSFRSMVNYQTDLDLMHVTSTPELSRQPRSR